MNASLAGFIDWSALQLLTIGMPLANSRNPRLQEAIDRLQAPYFIPAESEPARVEFNSNRSGLRFRFPTPQPCEFAENNVVYGRLYRCAARWQQRPVIVLLHGRGDSFGYRFRYPFIARRCNRAGFNAATLVAPYHFHRSLRQLTELSYPDYLRDAEATAQAVAEIRAFTGWLLEQGCPAVALWGYSFGAWLAGLTVCRDARFAAAIMAAPRVRMDPSFAEVILRRRIRESWRTQRAALESLNNTPLNLVRSRPTIPTGNILLIEAMHDLFVGTEPIEDLWRAWGLPDIWRLPHGHVSKSLLPGLTGRVLCWLAPRISH